MIDENEFFRKATLRICGDLAIENALHRTLLFIRDTIPTDAVFLEYFDTGLGAMRTIAKADITKGHRLDLITPLSATAREALIYDNRQGVGTVTIINRPAENPVSTSMLRFHGFDEKAVSLLLMQLLSEQGILGGIVFIADGLDRYTDGHAHLISLLDKPLNIALANSLVHREVLQLRDRLADDNRYLNQELIRISGDEIVGADFGLRNLMRLVRQVAPTDSPVLLTGETGVGKDVIANVIHLGSHRREGPFIPVNCGAIPAPLLDSELFGHEKGAFTGALSLKRGRFERADKGTILLDEIGEMPLDAQVRLLRVIQYREVERLGGTERIPVDIRIIAATNKDLAAMVREGRFREDLWFRLNVFPITVPPLRERRSDIPALVQYFVDRKARELKINDTPRLADGAVDRLMAYDWPGNVRELENIIERALILHRGKPLRFDGLGDMPPTSFRTSSSAEEPQSLELDDVITNHISRILRITGGKIHGPGGAGELLAVNPNTLRYKMKRLGIPFQMKRGMKMIRKQLVEFCPKCQKSQNIKGMISTRSVENPDGSRKFMVTVSYHCEVCNAFVRSEEHEDEGKGSISE